MGIAIIARSAAKRGHLIATTAPLRSLASASAAFATVYPSIFDDNLLVHMHLNMTTEDWDTIVNDATFSIYKPAMMWGQVGEGLEADTEAPILVSIRRKSSIPICNDPTKSCKVSFKISVDEYKDIYDAGCKLTATPHASCEDMPAHFRADLTKDHLQPRCAATQRGACAGSGCR